MINTFVFLPLLLLAPTQHRALITHQEVTRLEIHPGMPTSQVIRVSFLPKDGMTIKGCFSITSKGNGCLEICGLSILIYDAHDDGVTFEGGLLDNEMTDVNGDGFADLVLSGTALVRDPSNENLIRRVPVKAVFLFDAKSNCFKQTASSPYISVN